MCLCRGVAQLGSASVSGAEGRRFKSSRPDIFVKIVHFSGLSNLYMSALYIDKLAWIYIKDKHILTARSKGKDTYYIPGGKREVGESDHQALIREINEELSICLCQDSLKPIGVFEAQAHGKPPGTMVRMTCYSGDYIGDIKASSEIEEISWMQHKNKHKTSAVDILIFDWLKQQSLID